ncbi:MAG: M20/M25/M40 family metallo-hydrolase [Clostridia bacterium]|nr:M20/M25/M40 family metallo-hydrolase [Clostridia bacterium]
MRYLLYLLIAAVCVCAVLFLVAVINAIRIKAKPVDKKSAAPFTKEDEDKYARILSEMIKVPTVSAAEGDDLTEFRKLQAVLKESFPLIHEKLERTDLDGNLLYRWKGKNSDADGILLMGHQDVVPASEKGWDHPPFGGEIADGRVYGRGAMDCKCTVMAEFAAVEELLEEGFEPERDVYLSTSVNEEISGGGAEKIVEYLKNNGIRLAAVMDEGGAIVENAMPGMKALTAAAGVAEKGTCNIKFIARSKGGHSSTPPSNTPFARLAKFICRIEKKNPFEKKFNEPVKVMFRHVAPYLSFPFRLLLGNLWFFKPLIGYAMPKISGEARAFLSATIVFTMSSGSKAPNVIPDEAYVIANIRPSINQSAGECIEILRQIAKKYDIETEVMFESSASDVTDYKSEEFRYLGDCVAEVFPEMCFTPYYCTGGTDCRKYNTVSENCIRFTPIRMDDQQLAAMHAVNENISTDAVAAGVKFYKYYIRNHK